MFKLCRNIAEGDVRTLNPFHHDNKPRSRTVNDCLSLKYVYREKTGSMKAFCAQPGKKLLWHYAVEKSSNIFNFANPREC